MISALLAAAFTFTASATGVEKGTPVEFAFAGKGSDRDYEAMFVLDISVQEFCRGLEQAGFPRGRPADVRACRLWPVGCALDFSPKLERYVAGKMPETLPRLKFVYTGGTRLADGSCEANTNMPLSAVAYYSIAQSPVVPDGICNQGDVYGSFTAAATLKKGEKVKFTVTCDPSSAPTSVSFVAKPGGAAEIVRQLRTASQKGEVDAFVDFDGELTVAEATALARALATLDSSRIRVNGCGTFFYRSFLPLVKWLDRKERLIQPFEVTLGDTPAADMLVFVEEDWSVEGNDPKLTLHEIQFAEAARKSKTDTCFVFVATDTKISRVLPLKERLKGTRVQNWYFFAKEQP